MQHAGDQAAASRTPCTAAPVSSTSLAPIRACRSQSRRRLPAGAAIHAAAACRCRPRPLAPPLAARISRTKSGSPVPRTIRCAGARRAASLRGRGSRASRVCTPQACSARIVRSMSPTSSSVARFSGAARRARSCRRASRRAGPRRPPRFPLRPTPSRAPRAAPRRFAEAAVGVLRVRKIGELAREARLASPAASARSRPLAAAAAVPPNGVAAPASARASGAAPEQPARAALARRRPLAQAATSAPPYVPARARADALARGRRRGRRGSSRPRR